MNEIPMERFEAWIFSQPDERPFDYCHGQPGVEPPCLLCAFANETFGGKWSVGSDYIRNWSGGITPISAGVLNLLSRVQFAKGFLSTEFTAAHAKAAYIAIFGDPLSEPSSPAIRMDETSQQSHGSTAGISVSK